MEQPWGLSGPEFLVLYGGAVVVWCAVVAVVGSAVKAQRSPGTVTHVPDLYERAFLNGGGDRVVDTALAGLIDDGRVRVTRAQELHRADIGGEDDVQREVWSLIGRPGKLGPLRKAFRRSDVCDSLRRRLVDEGLLVTPRPHALLRALVRGFPVLALIAVVRGVNGLVLGYPVGYLVLELAATLIAWAAAAVGCGHPLRTRAGDAMRKRTAPPLPDTGEYSGNRPHSDLGAVVVASAVELVAQRGLGAHPDPTVARLAYASGTGGGAGGGSSSCGGSGGGCGGGGA
ncbi:TIGR04222 domain-containing membrane protein [Saccharopolyspora mangrovi]|uniref:TIGR04222 domain-containing membrane protein n=1 Tax=Saccharopolyspora mangrovi TaxID=3082379 RepID=A0ABU6AJ40_9PSEU|nr:TIGR04222 domain-containing membrane protein [Saccharopolyspora sp. S2-29]MEB3371589.1 TIGR04222 domain-containing membrane protein [Saccharopolyspora sp. S2-29]